MKDVKMYNIAIVGGGPAGILAAISAATYGMNPLFALPLYDGGMDLFSVLFLSHYTYSLQKHQII